MIRNPAQVLENILSQIRKANVLPTTDENKALFLECIFSEYKLDFAIKNNWHLLVQKITRVIENLSAAGARRNETAYERLLILGFPDKQLCQFDQDSINLFDQFFKQLLTFKEPDSLISSNEYNRFFENAKIMADGFRNDSQTTSKQILERMRSNLQNVLSFQRVDYFGFALEEFIARMKIERYGFHGEDFFPLVDSCLLPHYADRKTLPGSEEERGDFLDFIITQFHRGCAGEGEFNVDVISQRLKSIVAHAITHPESYQKRNLDPGEPGYPLQVQHGTFAQKSAANRAALSGR